ncbi:hypothetical protein [Yersinia intermedia]|uniref:hypothetical protein n=1 Tax=Yersinia intermedia TaxID=631 RepID=UPI000A85BDCF|nr:hypothetical protein [Yersinia intermedia]
MEEEAVKANYVLPKFCPICAEIMDPSTITVGDVALDTWKCPECGYEEIKE